MDGTVMEIMLLAAGGALAATELLARNWARTRDAVRAHVALSAASLVVALAYMAVTDTRWLGAVMMAGAIIGLVGNLYRWHVAHARHAILVAMLDAAAATLDALGAGPGTEHSADAREGVAFRPGDVPVSGGATEAAMP